MFGTILPCIQIQVKKYSASPHVLASWPLASGYSSPPKLALSNVALAHRSYGWSGEQRAIHMSRNTRRDIFVLSESYSVTLLPLNLWYSRVISGGTPGLLGTRIGVPSNLNHLIRTNDVVKKATLEELKTERIEKRCLEGVNRLLARKSYSF